MIHAILLPQTFLSALPAEELRPFLHLMMRGLVPRSVLDKLTAAYICSQSNIIASASATGLKNGYGSGSGSGSSSSVAASRSAWGDTDRWFGSVEEAVLALRSPEMASVSWEKQVGFLHLLEHMIKILGFGISPYLR